MTLTDDLTKKFRRLVELRDKRDEAKTASEKAGKEYEEYEETIFDEVSESAFKGAIKLDLGPPYGEVSFTNRETPYGRIIDADAAREYFEEHGELDELSDAKFSKSKLNEIVKERLEQQKSMPPGVDFYHKRGITISRSKD